jgi:hypothetical protein
MHVVSRYTAADAAGTIDPRGRAIALSVVLPPGLAVKHGSRYRGDRHAESADGTERGLRRRVGIHARSLALSLAPAATRWAFLLSAAGWLLALVAWYGGQDWPACCRAWRAAGGGGCRLARCGGTVGGVGRVSGATLLSVVVAIAATLLTWHTAGAGRSGVCFAFAVLLDWALLGALIVRIRQQESAA